MGVPFYPVKKRSNYGVIYRYTGLSRHPGRFVTIFVSLPGKPVLARVSEDGLYAVFLSFFEIA